VSLTLQPQALVGWHPVTTATITLPLKVRSKKGR